MKLNNRHFSTASFLSVVSASVLVALSPVHAATIVSPDSEVAGKTIGEWTVDWWQWALGQSSPNDAFSDTTGENAGVNQSGPIFFVAGTTGGSATRTFTVPSNKYLLFPLVNVSISNIEDPSLSEQEISSQVTMIADLVDSLEATIDGVPIANPFDYRATAPDFFSYTTAENNPFLLPIGTTEKAFADGYYVMIEPLKSGTTTTFSFGGGVSAFDFTTGVTTTITAVPEASNALGVIGAGLGMGLLFGVGQLKRKSAVLVEPASEPIL